LNSQSLSEAVIRQIQDIGCEAIAVCGDVGVGEDVNRIVGAVIEKWGRIDILINNAGAILEAGDWKDVTEKGWQRTLDVNLKGAAIAIKAVAPGMLERKCGTIVNMSSTFGILGGAPVLAYTVAKAGLINITRAFAKALAPAIRVNAIAPGIIDTDMTRSAGEQIIDAMVQDTLLKRLGRPEEIADAVVFLASHKASFITGHVLVVDGGHILK
jgi:NAD(P)-dependent dehydrogenase (short-subunit alcohol dehydrogenase family)